MHGFRLRSMFLVLTSIAVCLGVSRAFGFVFGAYAALLILLSVVFESQSPRVRLGMIAFASAVAASPFFGPRYSFYVPGTGWPMPVCQLALPHYVFRPFYKCGEFPLKALGLVFRESFSYAIFFHDSFSVRPFIIFAAWTGIALTLLATLAIAKFQAVRQSRRQIASPPPESSTVLGLESPEAGDG